ncbi:MAG TPA: DUF952 domain-containing protein [Hyphomicrobiaceae bacterium]|nr:DUF952 domain-containing protein [Hyphomicrobiaceae bacterium]
MAAPESLPDFIYKVAETAVSEAAQARGDFPLMPIDENDGYIHFSTAAQLRETLRLHFAGRKDLTLLSVRPATLGAGLRWEPSRGSQLFPHLYGPLSWSAVVNEARIAVDGDGDASLPIWAT